MTNRIEPHVSSVEQLTIQSISSAQMSGTRVAMLFLAKTGPLTPTMIDSTSDFLAKYSLGSVSRSEHTSFFHALKVSQYIPIMAVRVSSQKLSAGIALPSNTAVQLKNGNVITNKATITLNVAQKDPFQPTDASTYAIQMGQYYFCTPNYQKSGSDGISDAAIRVEIDEVYGETAEVNYPLFLDGVKKYINMNTDANMTYTLTIPDATITEAVIEYSGQDMVVKDFAGPMVSAETQPQVENQFNNTTTNDDFVLAMNYPAETNPYEFSITNIVKSGKYYQFDLTLTDTNDAENSGTYTLSTNPTAVDGYGTDIYLTSLNELRSDICIVDLKPTTPTDLVEVDATPFGAIEMDDEFASDTIPQDILQDGLDQLEALDSTRIAIFSDSGLSQPAFQSQLITMATAFKAFAVLSTPDYNTADLLVQYRSNMASDTSFAHFSAPWNDEKALVDFTVPLSSSAYYLCRLGQNIQSNVEYAPIYGKTTGIVEAENLHKNFRQSDRERLQNVQINPIYFNEAQGISYLVNNLTATSVSSDLQEDHIRRIINTMRYDIDLLMENYLSWDWTQDTCDKIVDTINNYTSNALANLGRNPIESVVPTATLTTRNHVKVSVEVRPIGSVKYINVYYNILSMA